jgi:hypothetical protein
MLSLFCHLVAGALKGSFTLTPHTVRKLPTGMNTFSFSCLYWLCVGTFFAFFFCYTYDIMKPAFLSVPAAAVHCFTEHNHIHIQVPSSHARASIIYFLA